MKQKQEAANLQGQEVTIKAGAESLYGKHFAEDTTGKLIRDYARNAYYYSIRLDRLHVVVIPREFVILP